MDSKIKQHKQHRTTNHSKNIKEKLWNKADTIDGKNPKLYRLDPAGNKIYYHSYGKDSEMGWQKNHIKAPSKGGSDDIINLQVLQTECNKKKVKVNRHKVM